MKIQILSIQKTQDAHIVALEDEYVKRTKRFSDIECVTIRSTQKPGEIEKRILRYIKRSDIVILLSEKGREYSSVEFANSIKKWTERRVKRLTFLIGGASGVDNKVIRYAHEKMSLSKMTFPHKLARLLLLEAIYRSFSIINNLPYHK